MSPSSLKLYKESPLTHYLSVMKHIPPQDDIIQCYGDGGNVVHKYLENYLDKKEPNDLAISWVKKGMDDKLDFNGRPLSLNIYKKAAKVGIEIIEMYKELGYELASETKFQQKVNTVAGWDINLKGFVDLIAKKGDDVILLDYKTNGSKKKGEFDDQMLFYALLYWMKTGIVPKKAIWYYLKLGSDKTAKMEFTEQKLLDFEQYLYSVIEDIIKKGDDWKNYPVGDLTSPFNGYKTQIKELLTNTIEDPGFNNIPKPQLQKDEVLIIIKDSQLFFHNIKPELIKLMIYKFSYELKQSYFIKKALAKKGVNIDGYKRFYNVNENSLSIGFLSSVQQYFKDNVINYKIEDQRIKLKDYKMPEKLLDRDLFDYQGDSVDFVLEKIKSAASNEITTLEMATGSGKTTVAAELIRLNKGLTVFVVDRDILLQQTIKAYEIMFGMKIGSITKGQIDLRVINVATIQTLNSLLKKKDKDIIKILYHTKTLIIDEAHCAAANSYQLLGKNVPNATLRIGLTGTYDRIDGNLMMIEAVVGKNNFKIEAKTLEKSGHIMKPEIYFIKYDELKRYEVKDLKEEKKLPPVVRYLSRYRHYITQNPIRNGLIVELTKAHYNKNLMIIVNELEHGRLLKKEIEKFYKDIVIIDGSVPTDVREGWLDDMRAEKLKIIIATASIVQKGLDIDNLGVMINATGNDSLILSLQSLGRILRKVRRKGIIKDACYYFDFYDIGEQFTEHTLNRIKALKSKKNEVKFVKQRREVR